MLASGGCGLIYGRSTMSMACTGSAASRAFQAGAKYGNAEFIQVHPTAIPGADKLRLMSESARGEGGRVWVPRKPQDPRRPATDSRSRALLLPRRALSEVRQPGAARHRHARDLQRLHARRAERRAGPAVRLPRRDAHSARDCSTASSAASWTSTRSSRASIRANVPMKIFPAVHYSMGGLWVDYEAHGRRRAGRRLAAQPADQHSRPVRHRRVRLPVSRRQPAGGQLAVELHLQRPDRGPGHRQPDRSRCQAAGGRAAGALVRQAPSASTRPTARPLLHRPGGGENPYLHPPGVGPA